MASTDLQIVIQAKDQYSAVFQGASQQASGFGSLLSEVSKIAAGFVLGQGIERAPEVLLSAAHAAADEEASILRLRQAVENTGVSWTQYEAVTNRAIEQAVNFGFTHDEARSALSLLAAQTGNTSDAMRRLSLAEDLSRGTSLDLETASRLLGKVTDENVTALQRYGIHVQKGASETELFAAVYEKFHGQAQTFADTTAGQMARMTEQWHQFEVQVGEIALPVLSKGITILSTDLAFFADKNFEVSDSLKNLEHMLGLTSETGQGAIQAQERLNERLKDTPDALAAANKAMAGYKSTVQDVHGVTDELDAAERAQIFRQSDMRTSYEILVGSARQSILAQEQHKQATDDATAGLIAEGLVAGQTSKSFAQMVQDEKASILNQQELQKATEEARKELGLQDTTTQSVATSSAKAAGTIKDLGTAMSSTSQASSGLNQNLQSSIDHLKWLAAGAGGTPPAGGSSTPSKGGGAPSPSSGGGGAIMSPPSPTATLDALAAAAGITWGMYQNATLSGFGGSWTQFLAGRGIHLQSGLDYVPFDNFPAVLHKGERVVPADENTGGGGIHLEIHGSVYGIDDLMDKINQALSTQLRFAGRRI